MIIWGGSNSTGALSSGGLYDPQLGSWIPMSIDGVPSVRTGYSAIWTGQEMIVWGGVSQTKVVNTGGRYAPLSGGADDDADGITTCAGDCDDLNATVYPGATQVCGDGLNNNCLDPSWPSLSGTNEGDDDGDGVTECGGDCDDTNASIHPGAIDIPGDPWDQDCGGGAVCDPAGTWAGHGDYVSCVDNECLKLKKAGLLTGKECDAIVKSSATNQWGGP